MLELCGCRPWSWMLCHHQSAKGTLQFHWYLKQMLLLPSLCSPSPPFPSLSFLLLSSSVYFPSSFFWISLINEQRHSQIYRHVLQAGLSKLSWWHIIPPSPSDRTDVALFRCFLMCSPTLINCFADKTQWLKLTKQKRSCDSLCFLF